RRPARARLGQSRRGHAHAATAAWRGPGYRPDRQLDLAERSDQGVRPRLAALVSHPGSRRDAGLPRRARRSVHPVVAPLPRGAGQPRADAPLRDLAFRATPGAAVTTARPQPSTTGRTPASQRQLSLSPCRPATVAGYAAT